MDADALLYIGLFFTALAAGSILPLQSEAAFVALLLAGHPAWLLLVVASAGNILGSVVNWALGRAIDRYRDRRWFPFRADSLDRARGWYQRYGRWSLLLSWVPIIGDPLTVVAGILRERLIVFVGLVTIAKTGRYAVLMWLTGRLVD